MTTPPADVERLEHILAIIHSLPTEIQEALEGVIKYEADLRAQIETLERERGLLRTFAEDVRDSKQRASNDEECVMAFVRLGNAARDLLATLAESEGRDELNSR